MPLGDKLTEKGVVDVIVFLCNNEAAFYPGDVKPFMVSDFVSAIMQRLLVAHAEWKARHAGGDCCYTFSACPFG